MPYCFSLLVQLALYAIFLALFNAGSSIAARIAMIAITISSSISVKRFLRYGVGEIRNEVTNCSDVFMFISLSVFLVLSNTSSFSWSVFELVLLLFEREPTDGIGSPPIELRITQSYP